MTIPGLPPPEVYELEYQYWPWGRTISLIENWVVEQAPRGALVVDYMCGCGYLLHGISRRRPDLRLLGNTFDKDWIDFARKRYPEIKIEYADSLEFQPPELVDIAIVTGGIHHLKPSQQPQFVAKVREQINHNGFFVVGEEVIPRHSSNDDRRLGVLKLGNALLSFVIEQHAPDLVLEAAADVIKRDLYCSGEYKVSLWDLKRLIEENFSIERCEVVWPVPETDFGDYFLLCRPNEQKGIL